jgi:predicted regulator of Ras-like GTPase activity (Roadblock/LC7/MglB family)
MEKVKAGLDAPRSPMVCLVAPPPAPAPGRPPSADASPVAPRSATALLDALVDEVHGVHGVILASVDGFGLARSTSMADEPAHPAMLAAAAGLAHQLASMADGQRFRQLVVDHDGGMLLVWPIGAERVLAVLAETTVEQRRVRAFVHSQSKLLAELPGVGT